MQRLIDGVERFRAQVYPRHEARFRELAAGQTPETLFVTCADSRVDPSLLTQTGPGELFVVRNPGNFVPPPGWCEGGEAAGLEYALTELGVRHVVVCGHSGCGALGAVVSPGEAARLPRLRRWLRHAEETRYRVARAELPPAARLAYAVRENVKIQLERLAAYPEVLRRLRSGEVSLHGWVYEIETGEVLVLDAALDEWKPLGGPRRAA